VLDEAAVREIRDRYAEGRVSQQRLADEFGVAQTTVSAIIRRLTWNYLK
jgi:DNA-binding Lrp family transcriptional regulator